MNSFADCHPSIQSVGARSLSRSLARSILVCSILASSMTVTCLGVVRAQPAPPKDGPGMYRASVVDKDTGRGIGGAKVRVSLALTRFQFESDHVTDEEGHFEFTTINIDPKTPYVTVRVEHPDYIKFEQLCLVRLQPDVELDGGFPICDRIELSMADSVTGLVVSPEGKPLKGVRVECLAGGMEYLDSDVAFELSGEGRFRSGPLLPDGALTVTAVAEGYESVSGVCNPVEGETQTLVLKLPTKRAPELPRPSAQPL